MVSSLLLSFLILLPIAAGLLCWPIRSRAWLEAVNLVSFFVLAILATCLGTKVLSDGTIQTPNSFLRADSLSALVAGLIAFVALVCGIYAVGYLRREESAGRLNPRQIHRYYVLTPILIGTMMAVPLVDNVGLLWVAMESSTLASVLLVRLYNQKSSLEAAWKYMMIGSAGIALALFGTVLVYFSAVQVLGDHAAGSFNWSTLISIADKCHPASMRLAFIMVLLGYGTKAGLAPMHTWKPDAYAEAPLPSAALLGAGFINCAVYGIIRFYALADKCLGPAYTSRLLILFGLASILIAAPFILVQRNFRRLLAYSSIDHAGIMVAAVGFGGRLGLLGAVLHMLFHAIAKPLLFFCAGNVHQHYASPYFRNITGVIRTLPWTGTLFLVAAFAVTGTPPFSLFQSEFIALSGALASNHPWAAALFVAGLVAIFSGLLVHMARLNLGRPAVEVPAARGPSGWMLGAMLLVAVPLVMFGWWLPAPLYALAQHAVSDITGGTIQ